MVSFCSTLNPPQSHLFLMFNSFHIISYFRVSYHNFFWRICHCHCHCCISNGGPYNLCYTLVAVGGNGMTFCFSFIVIFSCRSPLPHSLLFILGPNLVYSVSVLLNKQAFLCLAFHSTLNPPQSHLFLMFTSFHVISYFSFSSHIFFRGNCHCHNLKRGHDTDSCFLFSFLAGSKVEHESVPCLQFKYPPKPDQKITRYSYSV
jgi:hypothetical protein